MSLFYFCCIYQPIVAQHPCKFCAKRTAAAQCLSRHTAVSRRLRNYNIIMCHYYIRVDSRPTLNSTRFVTSLSDPNEKSTRNTLHCRNRCNIEACARNPVRNCTNNARTVYVQRAKKEITCLTINVQTISEQYLAQRRI